MIRQSPEEVCFTGDLARIGFFQERAGQRKAKVAQMEAAFKDPVQRPEPTQLREYP